MGKCLKSFGKDGMLNVSHPAHAAFYCSKEGDRLVSIQSCSEVSMLVKDMKQYSASSENTLFWLGLHYPGKSYSKIDARNWFDDDFIDS